LKDAEADYRSCCDQLQAGGSKLTKFHKAASSESAQYVTTTRNECSHFISATSQASLTNKFRGTLLESSHSKFRSSIPPTQPDHHRSSTPSHKPTAYFKSHGPKFFPRPRIPLAAHPQASRAWNAARPRSCSMPASVPKSASPTSSRITSREVSLLCKDVGHHTIVRT
jgi:hypothetical protein